MRIPEAKPHAREWGALPGGRIVFRCRGFNASSHLFVDPVFRAHMSVALDGNNCCVASFFMKTNGLHVPSPFFPLPPIRPFTFLTTSPHPFATIALSPSFCHRPYRPEPRSPLVAGRRMAPARSLTDLPEEMLIHVAAHVAASSENPMDDLRHLRGACSHMRDKVCGAALVHRSLNLRLVLQQSVDAAISEQLIVNTYAVGNLEARFIQGMRNFFGHYGGALHASLDDLDQAAHGGHKPAAYVLAMLLWRANSGAKSDLRAKQLLAEVVDDEQALTVCSAAGFACTRARLRHAVDVRVAS